MTSFALELAARGVRGLLDLPEHWLRRFAGPVVRNDQGAELDLQHQVMLKVHDRLGMSWDLSRPRRARAAMVRQVALVDVQRIELERVETRAIPGPGGPILVRVYTPSGPSPRPGLVYFHGGGFVLGNLDSHDRLCRFLAQSAGCVIVSVDYRLAPEHRCPCALDDCDSAFRWTMDHARALGLDPTNLAVGGDSAGGNLAALVCFRARDRGSPSPSLQVLLYPATDLTRAAPSHALFARGFMLTRETLDAFLEAWLGPLDPSDPARSPLLADDLSGLPRALVVTAGFDPLRDEGRQYARRLEEAGVRAELLEFPEQVHGFLQMGGAVRSAKAALGVIAGRVRAGLAKE